MTEPYIGQIEIYGFPFPPAHWAFAAGQLIPIQQNTTLFALIGSIYGGNGTTNFKLPNLASRQACGSGDGPGLTPHVVGETFGDFTVTVTADQMPAHNHNMNIFVLAPNQTAVPEANSTIGVPTSVGGHSMYAPLGTPTTMAPLMVQPAGGSQAHPNLQPYLALNYCIALQGTFPSWN